VSPGAAGVQLGEGSGGRGMSWAMGDPPMEAVRKEVVGFPGAFFPAAPPCRVQLDKLTRQRRSAPCAASA